MTSTTICCIHEWSTTLWGKGVTYRKDSSCSRSELKSGPSRCEARALPTKPLCRPKTDKLKQTKNNHSYRNNSLKSSILVLYKPMQTLRYAFHLLNKSWLLTELKESVDFRLKCLNSTIWIRPWRVVCRLSSWSPPYRQHRQGWYYLTA